MKTTRMIVYWFCVIPASFVILFAYLLRCMAIWTVDFMERLEGPAPCQACGCNQCCESEMCFSSYFNYKDKII